MRFFLKLPGILGSSTEIRHIRWIELTSLSAPPPHSRAPMRDPVGGDFTFTKPWDQSSGRLAEALMIGTLFATATVEFVDKNGHLVYGYDLTDVHLTSYSILGKTETFSMNPRKLNFRFGAGMKGA